MSKEINRETLNQTKWLSFKSIKYRDPNGIERKWDCVERTTRKSVVDGVDIIAYINDSENGRSIISTTSKKGGD